MSLRYTSQDQCPLPTSTLPGLHWGNYQGIENAHVGLYVGEQTVGDEETPLSLRSHRPVSGDEMNLGKGVHFSEYTSCRLAAELATYSPFGLLLESLLAHPTPLGCTHWWTTFAGRGLVGLESSFLNSSTRAWHTTASELLIPMPYTPDSQPCPQ